MATGGRRVSFLPALPSFDRVLNTELLSEPMSWFVVFLNATVALLLFHVVMGGFAGMQSKGDLYNAGPGQIAAPVATNFSAPGSLARDGGSALSSWWGGGLARGDGLWTNDFEAKFAEDGWLGNP